VVLPVADGDSLALRVEALRAFLDDALGTETFVRVYRCLEAVTEADGGGAGEAASAAGCADDDAAVGEKLVEWLGPERLVYLPLIHQLIISEAGMDTGW